MIGQIRTYNMRNLGQVMRNLGQVMKILKLLFLLAIFSTFIGCAKDVPAQIQTVKSPWKEVFYTVETYTGYGPTVSDETVVYANLVKNNKTNKVAVLSGDYLEIKEIKWTSPYDVSICIGTGATSTFRNEVYLMVSDAHIKIHNHLQEKCAEPVAATPVN